MGRNKEAIRKYIANQLQEDKLYEQLSLKEYIDPFTGGAGKRKQVKSSHPEVAAEKELRLPENPSTNSAAGTMRLKRLIKPPAKPVVLDWWVNYTINIKCSRQRKRVHTICGKKIKPRNPIYTKEICMNYHHFTIEERCPLREYDVKGKSYREIARLLGRNVSSISRELRRNCTFFKDIPRYYPYTAQKKPAKQLPSPRNILETRSIGIHRRKAVANVVSRTDSKHALRDEDAVIQDDLPMDR